MQVCAGPGVATLCTLLRIEHVARRACVLHAPEGRVPAAEEGSCGSAVAERRRCRTGVAGTLPARPSTQGYLLAYSLTRLLTRGFRATAVDL